MTPYYDKGGITIYCGECSKVLATFEPQSFDLTVTSPPYDDLREYQGYTFDFDPIARQLYRVTKQGGVVVWVVGDQTKDFCESLTTPKQKIYFVEACGFNLLDTEIFAKMSYAPAYPGIRRYASVFEYMLILSRGRPKTFNPVMTKRSDATKKRHSATSAPTAFIQKDGTYKPKKIINTSDTKQATNLRHYATGQTGALHPAPFPEALARDHIISWSNAGDLVLDPMMGSGTTLKMAQQLGRRAVGIDVSEDYCKIAVERLRQPTFWSSTVETEEARHEQAILL